MRAHGHEPCVVLRTSPGHLQAWVRVSLSPLEPALATSVARHLADLYGADRASADARRLGRLAGFTNQTLAASAQRLRSLGQTLVRPDPLGYPGRLFARDRAAPLSRSLSAHP